MHGLGYVARAVAVADPERAEQLANSVTGSRDSALSGVASALAGIDPDRAERLIHSITNGSSQVFALLNLARGVVAADPDRATRLLADAERIARSLTGTWKPWALVLVAKALR